MALDPNTIYQGQSQPDIGAIYGTAIKIKEFQQQQQSQNMLKQIMTTPGNLDADGLPTQNALKQIMQVSPAAGEKLIGLQSQVAERKALTDERRQKEFVDLDNYIQKAVRDPATEAYQKALKDGLPPEAAQAAGQRVYDEGLAEIKSSGRFGEDQTRAFDPHYDPARVSARTKMNAIANAPKSGDVETITDAQGNTFDHDKVRQTNKFVSGPAGLKPGEDYDPTGGVHKLGGAADQSNLDDTAKRYYAKLFRTLGPTALGRLTKGDRDSVIEFAAHEADAGGQGAADDLRTQQGIVGHRAEETAMGRGLGQLRRAEEEMEGAVKISHDAYSKLPRDKFTPFNELRNLYEKKTSSPEQAAAYAADNAIVNLYARMISPTGQGTDSDKAHAREMLNQAQGPEAHEAVLNQLMTEGKNALSKAEKAQQDTTASTPIAGEGDKKAAPHGLKHGLPDGTKAKDKTGRVVAIMENGQWVGQ